MSQQNFVNSRLSHLIMWNRHPKGEVGIEVEVEGGPWPEGPITNWESHVDNSLRNGGTEYVIRQPVARDRVRNALTTLAAGLAESRLVFSYRTSVHVHVNVQDLTFRDWCAFVVLFTTLEELLVDQVGPNRRGNKFCLRMKDADQPLQLIQDALRAQNIGAMHGDDIKYASMNIQATRTHGTLEFRAMEGNLDVDRICDWVAALLAIKDYARGLNSPRDIPEQLSQFGPHTFVARVLPDNRLRAAVLASRDLAPSIYEGVRIAQDVAYAIDWGEKEAAPVPKSKTAGLKTSDIEVLGEPVMMNNLHWAPLPQGVNLAQLGEIANNRPVRPALRRR